jgi:hypothetical protein
MILHLLFFASCPLILLILVPLIPHLHYGDLPYVIHFKHHWLCCWTYSGRWYRCQCYAHKILETYTNTAFTADPSLFYTHAYGVCCAQFSHIGYYSGSSLLTQHQVRGQSPSPLTGMFFLVCTTTYVRAYVVVIMFVCPHNYLNNVQDIIKLHFCQLRLVVSFNNIPYTHACTPQPHTAPLLGGSEVSHRIRSKYNGIFIDENTIFTRNCFTSHFFPLKP